MTREKKKELQYLKEISGNFFLNALVETVSTSKYKWGQNFLSHDFVLSEILYLDWTLGILEPI